MKYTVILKKAIKEIIGLMSIVLFIYTCTKMKLVAGHKRAAVPDTINTGTAVGFGWPQSREYHPLLPRHGLPQRPYINTVSGRAARNAATGHPAAGAYKVNMGAGDQAAWLTAP